MVLKIGRVGRDIFVRYVYLTQMTNRVLSMYNCKCIYIHISTLSLSTCIDTLLLYLTECSIGIPVGEASMCNYVPAAVWVTVLPPRFEAAQHPEAPAR